MGQMIKIAIVEDKESMVEYLRGIIADSVGMECIHAYSNAEEAINFIPTHVNPPDIVIVDIGLPRLSGIECVRQLRHRCAPSTQFMMHTVFATDDKIFESLRAGANGYLYKEEISEDKFRAAIIELYNEGAAMSPSIAKRVMAHFRGTPNQDPGLDSFPGLSADDIRLLKFIAEGKTNFNIAEELRVKENAIKARIYRLYKKLHVKNRAEAISKYRNPE